MPEPKAVPRPLVLALALGLAALIVAACAPEDDPEADPEDPEDAPEEDAPEDDEEADEDADDDAEGAEGLLEGELITFIVPFSTGGGYDTYSRLIAPYLEEELGADVTVENVTGAGGLLGVNQLLGEPTDGTVIAIANGPGIGGSALGEDEGVEFELEELSYLGRIAAEPKVWTVGDHTQWETIDDLMEDSSGFRWGATGPGASTYVDAELAMASTGVEADDIVTGYDGTEEIAAAIVAEEVDGVVSTLDSRIDPIDEGDEVPVAVIAEESPEELPDVPAIVDLDLDDDQMAVAQAHLDLTEFGRPLIGPPDMDEDALQELRGALERIVEDEAFLEDAEEQGRPIEFLPGEEVEAMVDELVDAPEEVLEILREAE